MPKLEGRAEPRLYTPEQRPLTRRTTKGFEVCDFAANVIGEPLLPWQKTAVVRGLELNPDGTFRFRVVLILVARQNGKTVILKTVSLWKLFVDGARLVLGVAQSLDIANEAWQGCVDIVQSVPDLASELAGVRYANGEKTLTLDGGGRYRIAAANRRAGRGLTVDQLNFDELREQRDWLAWGAVSKTTTARPNGQIWGTSNAGDEQSVVLNQLREAALSGADPSICLLEWSAPDGCELDDMDALAQANPALGHTLSLQALLSSRATDPPAVYRTEVLCQRVATLDGAVDMAAWTDCRDAKGTLDGHRKNILACVDVAPDGQHVTLAAGAELPGGRVRVEVVKAWRSTENARTELDDWLGKVDARAVGFYPAGPAAAIAPVLRKHEATEIKGTAVSEACMGFADLVAARRVVHAGDPLLTAHVSGATKLENGDGWRFVRRGAGHVDAAYAAAGVVHLVQSQAVNVPLPKPMVV